MILVCYDGSPDACAAIDRAAELMRGSEATVLTIWETLNNARTGAVGLGQGVGPGQRYAADQRYAAAQAYAVVQGRAAVQGYTAGPWHAAGQEYAAYYDSRKVNAARKRAALVSATEGAERAIAAGLRAQPRIASQPGYVGSALLAVADHIDAELIVLGTRGLGSVESLALGSVSRTVVRYADRAVLIIPSPYFAEQRRASALQAGVPAGIA